MRESTDFTPSSHRRFVRYFQRYCKTMEEESLNRALELFIMRLGFGFGVSVWGHFRPPKGGPIN